MEHKLVILIKLVECVAEFYTPRKSPRKPKKIAPDDGTAVYPGLTMIQAVTGSPGGTTIPPNGFYGADMLHSPSQSVSGPRSVSSSEGGYTASPVESPRTPSHYSQGVSSIFTLHSNNNASSTHMHNNKGDTRSINSSNGSANSNSNSSSLIDVANLPRRAKWTAADAARQLPRRRCSFLSKLHHSP